MRNRKKEVGTIAAVIAVSIAMCAGVILLTGSAHEEAREDTAAAVAPPHPAEAAIPGANGQVPGTDGEEGLPTVYMTRDISSEGLVRIYHALGRELPGKVAVKIHTGEPGGHHYLSPDLIKDLVGVVDATIVECNTGYLGGRSDAVLHMQVAADHGFTAIAPVDIMDEEGEVSLPVTRGQNITEDFVGSHFLDYDSFIILSHFKGHAMGGFGGAIKNMSVGIASAGGKLWIHSSGRTRTNVDQAFRASHVSFLESMAEAAGAVMESLEERVVYINVMNNLSVDCDCSSNPTPPAMADIGILASLDPVALDQACVDQVYAVPNAEGSAALKQRIETRVGTHTLDYAESLGLGSRRYRLVEIDG